MYWTTLALAYDLEEVAGSAATCGATAQFTSIKKHLMCHTKWWPIFAKYGSSVSGTWQAITIALPQSKPHHAVQSICSMRCSVIQICC